jgi:hypothetical protein
MPEKRSPQRRGQRGCAVTCYSDDAAKGWLVAAREGLELGAAPVSP